MQGEDRDVSKMIAEESRRAQNARMEQMMSGIQTLSDKSIIEDRNMAGIKEFIKYKYPKLPCQNNEGEDIYGDVLSKVESMWGYGELDDMKDRSKSRQGSPKAKTFSTFKDGAKHRGDSINVQDFTAKNPGGLTTRNYKVNEQSGNIQ